MNIDISLNDWVLAIDIGRKRQALEKKGIWKKGWSGRTIETESIGVIGEMLIARYLKVKPKFIFGKDDGEDLKINGKTIDVKTSLQKNTYPLNKMNMLVHKYQKPKDIYVFVVINENKDTAVLRGWCKREIVEESPIFIYKKCELFKIPNKMLKDIDTLKKEVNI